LYRTVAGVVSGFYGPGAVGGWLLSCASFLLSLLHPDMATHDALNNDLHPHPIKISLIFNRPFLLP
jgi:hypothetical protein